MPMADANQITNLQTRGEEFAGTIIVSGLTNCFVPDINLFFKTMDFVPGVHNASTVMETMHLFPPSFSLQASRMV